MSSGSIHGSFQIRAFFSAISGRYDLANRLLSCGCDYFWRKWVAREAAALRPVRILDVATGTGDLAAALLKHCPNSELFGVDFCLPMLRIAQAKDVPRLIVADALHLPFADGMFDVLTIAFGLRNMTSWKAALAEMKRVLRGEGTLLILDFSLPAGPIRPFYLFYIRRVLPILANILTGEKSAYQYLSDSIERFPCGAAMEMVLAEAGFVSIRTSRFSMGIVCLYACKKR